jgi:hypothetical protein
LGSDISAYKDYEVRGYNLGAFIDAFRQYPTVLAKYLIHRGLIKGGGTLADFDRNIWYPLVPWLQVSEDLGAEVGANSLYTCGKKIPELALLPPDIADIYSSLGSMDVAYHMNHKKNGVVMFDPATGAMLEGIGHFSCQVKEGEKTIVMKCDSVYPCDFDRGIVGGFAARFEPFARAVHDAGPCRKKGDKTCSYVVRW